MASLAMILAAAEQVTTAASEGAGKATPWWDVTKWDGTTWMAVSLAAVVTLLIVAWGATRFWLMATRPPALKDVHTPTLDRMNASALEHLGDEEPATEAVEAPADLLAAVPEEEGEKKGAEAKAEDETKKPA